MSFGTVLFISLAVIFGLILLIFAVMFATVARLWFRAWMSGASIGPVHLIVMKLKRIDPEKIVDCRVNAVQSGLADEITTAAMESHMLAGGRVPEVVRAMIAAQRAQIALDWDTAAAIDLAGRNVHEAVQTSVRTKVIDCPDPARSSRPTLDGIAKDGIQLKAKARVTVRTNISQLIGGAKAVLAKGLDSQTAYEIVSIDIADIDVGDNVGARLQADQAEADMRIARAHAEERRAAAVAHEQEMRALTQENQAEVVLSEAEVPRAMAGAYRRGVLRKSEP
jgi:uncharacterized protein YqfA (UPF0365 family)